MIRAVLLSVALGLATPAVAQVGAQVGTQVGAQIGAPADGALRPTPSLKAAVTVNSDVVRIGDLVDNAGAAAMIPIFRSPDIGTTGAVPVAQVLDAIGAHDLYLVDTRALTEIEVTRAGLTIASKDIEARIARVFAGRQGLGEEKSLMVTLDREIRPIRVDAASAGELSISRATYDRRAGRFDVTFEIARKRALYRFTGSLVEMVEVAVLTRQLPRGDVLRDQDIAIERRPKAEITADAVDSAARVVGLASRQALPAGRIVRQADFVKPDLVRRDEPVTLVFEAPGMTLTSRGKALETGSEGDLVNVVNVQSKRTIQGHVSGPGRVTVSSSAGHIPESTVAATPTRVRAE
jgi:flagella basal body P-ring formation protein FlgA